MWEESELTSFQSMYYLAITINNQHWKKEREYNHNQNFIPTSPDLNSQIPNKKNLSRRPMNF